MKIEMMPPARGVLLSRFLFQLANFAHSTLSPTNYEVLYALFKAIPESLTDAIEDVRDSRLVSKFDGARPPLRLQGPGFIMELDPLRKRSDLLALFLRGDRLYEPETTRFFQRSLRPGCVFVDIGANEGWYTLLAASIVGSLGHVYSIEPNETVLKVLEDNVHLNAFEGVVSVHGTALGNCVGDAALFIPPRDAMASLTFRGGRSRRVVVPLTTLDALLGGREVDILKIDVEGFEDEVIAGSTRLIEEHSPQIVFEYSPYILFCRGRDYERPFRRLRKLGYSFRVINPDGKPGETIISASQLKPRVTNIVADPPVLRQRPSKPSDDYKDVLARQPGPEQPDMVESQGFQRS